MQYAIIQTGGKQYQVEPGKTYEFELLHNTTELVFDQVLLLVDGAKVEVGAPYVEGAVVKATILQDIKSKKIDILRYKSKSRYRKHTGHRQKYSQVRIDSIENTKKQAEVVKESPVKKLTPKTKKTQN